MYRPPAQQSDHYKRVITVSVIVAAVAFLITATVMYRAMHRTPTSADTAKDAPSASPTTDSSPAQVPVATSSPSPTPSQPQPEEPYALGQTRAQVGSAGARTITNTPPKNAITITPTNGIASTLRKVPAGATIVLRGGIYRESIGVVTKKVTLQAFPGDQPVISGADIIKEWTKAGSGWRTTTWKSTLASNTNDKEITKDYAAAGKVEQVYRDGKALRQRLPGNTLRAGEFYIDSQGHAVVSEDPTQATMEVTTRNAAIQFDPAARTSTVRGLRFAAFGTQHRDTHGQVLINASGVTFEDVWIDHSSGAGLVVMQPNVSLTRLTISDNGSQGAVFSRAVNTTMTYSLLTNNNVERFNAQTCRDECSIAALRVSRSENTSLSHNVITTNYSPGAWFDISSVWASVTQNTIANNVGTGLLYKISSRATISGNMFQNNRIGVEVRGSDRVTLTKNSFENNAEQLRASDDARTPASTKESYSLSKKLSWNTVGTVVKDNKFIAGQNTTTTLMTGATKQIDAADMFASLANNILSGNNETFVWDVGGKPQRYTRLSDFQKASKLNFGTVQ